MEENLFDLRDEKRKMLGWAIYIGLVLLAIVLGDNALGYAPVFIQAVTMISITFIGFLFLYAIKIRDDLDLKLALLAVIGVGYCLFKTAVISIKLLHPFVIGSVAIAMIILLFGFIFYPTIKPHLVVAVRESKVLPRYRKPRFPVTEVTRKVIEKR